MTGEHGPPASERHEPEPRRRAARPGSPPGPVDLERLRDLIRRRLDQIETLARERLESGHSPDGSENSESERELLRRVTELEEANERIRGQAERHEQDWRSAFDKLEEDRKLLADAWERLERARIEVHVGPAHDRGLRTAPSDRPAAPQVRSQTSGTPDDSVTQAILKQFHQLRSDVRRTANQRKAR
jgi:DNA repair exonuclease SbcCD ATPase subunit